MIKTILRLHFLMVFVATCSTMIFTPLVVAQEVDFSCMKESVRTKTQVSNNYREYDIILENRCSVAVYWSMCIERINPWTNEISETLTPSARVVADKKFRINLQMKKQEEDSHVSYEKFYVNLEYDLHSPPQVSCAAYPCEMKKRALRAEYRSNERALADLRSALANQISKECTRTGWSEGEKENCRARVSKDYRKDLSDLGIIESTIKERLSEVDPEQCEIHPEE